MLLNMKCNVQTIASYDDFGNVNLSEPIVAACFKEAYVTEIRKADGSVVFTSFRYFVKLPFELSADLFFDGKKLLKGQALLLLSGEVQGYEVYV